MITSAQCEARFGKPTSTNKCMTLWDVPTELEIGHLPKRIYCNKFLVEPLAKAFTKLIETGLVSEILTWDGCFNIRLKRRGGSMSLHSWGLAVDINAFDNPMGGASNWSPEFVKCFTDSGFDWGGYWTIPDPMHFQLKEFPK